MQPPEDRPLIGAAADGSSFKGVEWNTKDIEVLRIPFDSSHYSKKTTNTIDVNKLPDRDVMVKVKGDAFDIDHDVGHDKTDKLLGDIIDNHQYHSQDGIVDDETAVSEQWVKHVPDLRKFSKKSGFDWRNRSLVIANINTHDPSYPEDAKGYWCMYKCNEPIAGSSLGNAEKNKYFWGVEHARAFGDVYVFRLEDITPDRFGRRKYAKTWEIPEDSVAREIFVSLALCHGGEEIVAKEG